MHIEATETEQLRADQVYSNVWFSSMKMHSGVLNLIYVGFGKLEE